MNRRRGRSIAVIAGILVVLAVATWLWLSASATPPSETDPRPDATQSRTPLATTEVRDLAQQQLDEHLEDCTVDADSAGAVPEGCGIRIPWGTEFAAVDGIRFRIDRLPVLEITDDGFVADGGILIATVSGTGQDGAARTETYRTESWSLRGDVTVDGTEVDVDVW